MRSPSSLVRVVMVFCAVTMLLAQLMGLHFHRHVADGASAAHAAALHLHEGGAHVHAATAGHHAIDDGSAHPDADLEIDALGAGLAQMFNLWLPVTLLLAAVLVLFPARPLVRIPPDPPRARVRSLLFVLSPPSHAPPLKLSTVR